MKNALSILLILVGLLAGQTVYAQTTVNSTTLSTAITDTGATTTIALASIGSGSTAVLAGHVLLMDGEAMIVRTTPTSATNVVVNRARLSTRGQMHAANTIVYYGPSQAFVVGVLGQQFYQGRCTSSANLYTPILDVANTTIGECDSVTSQWKWTRLSAPFGNVRPYHQVVNANYTAKITDEIIGITSLQGGKTITLPAATGLTGKYYVIQDESGSAGTGTATITISPSLNGGNLTQTITTGYGAIVVRSNGTYWFKQ